MPSDAWQQRVDELWASFDDHDEDAFVAKIEALASELPDDSPEAAFERASAFDSTGHSDRAVPLYRRALELGLRPPLRLSLIHISEPTRRLT